MPAGLRRFTAIGAMALVLGACQAPTQPQPSATSPPSAQPSPSASAEASGAPLAGVDAQATFGAITAIAQESNRPQVIYDIGLEDPSHKNFGTADAHFLTVGGTRYAIAPADWSKLAALAVGATVNLYPSASAVVFQNADGTKTTSRLMDVYPGSHAEPPLFPAG